MAATALSTSLVPVQPVFTDAETFAREMEAKGRARATVTRRLCTIAGFYKYAVEEELLDHSPIGADLSVLGWSARSRILPN